MVDITAGSLGVRDGYQDVIARVQARLAKESELGHDLLVDPARTAAAIRKEAGVIADADVLAILRRLREEAVGAGVLEPVINAPDVTDVVVNGPSEVFLDRGSGLERAAVTFADDHEVRRLATRLVNGSGGGRLDEAAPYADARFVRADGAIVRVHAVLSPPAANATLLSLRVLRQARLHLADLVARQTVPLAAADRLRELVERKESFLVVGGTGSGKTTLLSALLGECPAAERIVVIEDTAELNPEHPHVVAMTSRRANVEGRGEITLSDLARQALRMRPDRLIVGEIRGAEIVDMLAAMNTGHDGGAGTLHANSLQEVPARIEALAAMGGLDRGATHAQLAAAIRTVLVMRRNRGGQRELAQIGRARLGSRRLVSFEPVWEAEDER